MPLRGLGFYSGHSLTIDYAPAASVLHFRYAADAATPWRGNGPVEVAALAGRLSTETVRALAEESSGPALVAQPA